MIERSIIHFLLGTCLVLPMAAHSDTFSIVQITDSQYYSERHPEIMEAQIDWIVANEVGENIIYVAQTGDLKDDSSCDNKTVNVGTGAGRTEWQIANQAFSDLDTANIAYGVLPGNHDFEPVSSACPTDWLVQRTFTLYNSLFGPARFAGDPFYGDPLTLTPGNRVGGSNEDNFTLFDSNGVGFISINLAFRPDLNAIVVGNPELTWANNLLQTYPDRLGIVTSHYFMETNPGNALGPYGQGVYDALSNNRNLFMMLAGHWYGEAWRTETTGRGAFQPVQIMMANYQAMEFPDDTDPVTPPGTPTPNPAFIDFSNITAFRGGAGDTDSGFMRIMRFDTQTGAVDIETFIPPVVPIKNRTTTIVSTYFPASGAGMGEFTASNLGLSYLGYSSQSNGFDIFECDTDTGGTCNDLIGSIALPSGSGSQSNGSGITFTYTCSGSFCDSAGYDENDIQSVDWTINGSGQLTAFDMVVDTDPSCPDFGNPVACIQSRVDFSFISTGLTGNTAQSVTCDGIGCISGISTNNANQFTPH